MIAEPESLARLMAATQRGDAVAYRSLLDHCEGWLRRFYARRVPIGVIDDLVQETLLSLHRKRASYDPARPFLPWLAAIARYRWVDHLRKVYRREEGPIEGDFGVESHGDSVLARLSVDRLLERITPVQCEAIRLVKIEGLTIAEASARCGQSESAVKVNIHRGVKKLAAMIESE